MYLKRLLFGLLAITLFAAGQTAYAAIEEVNFFHGDGCPHCAIVQPFIDEMAQKYPDITFNQYEVYHDMDNALLLQEAFEKYDVPANKRGVPVLFLDGTYFIGDKPIMENLEDELIRLGESEVTAYTNGEETIDPVQPEPEAIEQEEPEVAEPEATQPAQPEQPKTVEPISLWVITGMALVDSINPCAIAVLVILLGALMLINEKKRALKGGLAFTAAIYISYFLFGLGISYTLQFAQGMAFYIFKGVGVLAVIIGLANIKDFFWYGGGGFVMEIPRKWRPTLIGMLKKVTSPLGAFLIGFAVTLFELPCTGGPYFVVLGLLSAYGDIYRVIPILLYYNVFFVLPLLVITALIYFGLSSVEEAGKWKERNIKALHLVSGLVMVGLGIWILIA